MAENHPCSLTVQHCLLVEEVEVLKTALLPCDVNGQVADGSLLLLLLGYLFKFANVAHFEVVGVEFDPHEVFVGVIDPRNNLLQLLLRGMLLLLKGSQGRSLLLPRLEQRRTVLLLPRRLAETKYPPREKMLPQRTDPHYRPH